MHIIGPTQGSALSWDLRMKIAIDVARYMFVLAIMFYFYMYLVYVLIVLNIATDC